MKRQNSRNWPSRKQLTYDNIEGLDYQILVEADFLVNLYEDDVNRHGIEQAYQQIFRTQTGKEIFNQMYTDER